MQLTCPRCAERFSLESAVEDESGRALMALLGRVGVLSRELVVYLGLFRPRTQALRWSRAQGRALSWDRTTIFGGSAALKEPPARRPRKAGGYAMPPGTGPEGETCGTCGHHVVHIWSKRYHKCALVKPTRGPGTDIRVRSPACAKWIAVEKGGHEALRVHRT